MQEFEEDQAMKLERLRREVRVGSDQIERGEVVDGAQVFAELEECPQN